MYDIADESSGKVDAMRYALEHFGVAVCAITGALAGRGKRVDLFGIMVLALVTAVGGGTIRDLVLGARVFWVVDSSFVVTASVAAAAAFIWGRVAPLPHGFLLVADAFGLALFTTIGAEKSLAYGAPPAVAVMLAVITGVAGGMLRDVLSGEIPLVLRHETYLYATAAFCGAVLLVALSPIWAGSAGPPLAALGLTLALRLAAIRWRLRLPLFRLQEEKGEA